MSFSFPQRASSRRRYKFSVAFCEKKTTKNERTLVIWRKWHLRTRTLFGIIYKRLYEICPFIIAWIASEHTPRTNGRYRLRRGSAAYIMLGNGGENFFFFFFHSLFTRPEIFRDGGVLSRRVFAVSRIMNYIFPRLRRTLPNAFFSFCFWGKAKEGKYLFISYSLQSPFLFFFYSFTCSFYR